MRCNPHHKLRYDIDRNGRAMRFVSQRRVVAKLGASQTVEEVKCFRALVQVTYVDAKRNAMVGGSQGVCKVLGFRVSSREF